MVARGRIGIEITQVGDGDSRRREGSQRSVAQMLEMWSASVTCFQSWVGRKMSRFSRVEDDMREATHSMTQTECESPHTVAQKAPDST